MDLGGTHNSHTKAEREQKEYDGIEETGLQEVGGCQITVPAGCCKTQRKTCLDGQKVVQWHVQ